MIHIGKFDSLTKTIVHEGVPGDGLQKVNEVPFEEVELVYRRVRGMKYALYTAIPFIGSLLQELHIHITRDVPTMAVDNKSNIYINPEWVQSDLSNNEHLKFVLAHEALHVGMLTHFRERGRNHEVWNWATDAIINYCLTVDGLQPPAKGILPNAQGDLVLKDEKGQVILTMNVAGKTAEEVYQEFMKKMPEKEEGNTLSGKWKPEVGNVIFNNQTGEYGVIEEINGEDFSIRKINEKEAATLAKQNPPTYEKAA